MKTRLCTFFICGIRAVAFITAMILIITVFQINAGAETNEVILTIIHMNDVHGRTNAEPHISALANDLRSGGGNVLILDAGDRLHGQTTANLSRGESMVRVMNAVGYSAMTAGNHDFNFGLERLLELSKIMDFPVLAANVKDSSGRYLFERSKVFEFSGITVGVFGLTTPETMTKSDSRIVAGLTFEDPVQTATVMVEELKNAGCTIIIALTHLGDDNATQTQNRSDSLAVLDIDIVIDGHSHSHYENGKVINNTLFAQAGGFGEYIGVVEILSSGEMKARTIAISDELPADEAIVALITQEETQVEPIISEVVGNSPYFLNGERVDVRTGETNLSNLITDSMIYATGADISFLTGGNIRASIEAGDITMGQVLTTLPFSNMLVTVELSGLDILEMLEHGVSQYPDEVGSFIHVAGMSFTFTPDSEAARRVKTAVLSDGRAIEPNQTYIVATIEFLAFGGDGYDMLKNNENLVYYGGDAEAFADYLRTNPVIKSEAEGRVSIFTDEINELIGASEKNPLTGVSGIVVIWFVFTGAVMGLSKKQIK
jgi:5'-nucleotidase